MVRLEPLHRSQQLVLPGQEGQPEVVGALPLPKAGPRHGADAGALQQRQRVVRVGGVALGQRLGDGAGRQVNAGEGIHGALRIQNAQVKAALHRSRAERSLAQRPFAGASRTMMMREGEREGASEKWTDGGSESESERGKKGGGGSEREGATVREKGREGGGADRASERASERGTEGGTGRGRGGWVVVMMVVEGGRKGGRRERAREGGRGKRRGGGGSFAVKWD